MPLISVIIPVYNTEKYLRECLDSVINQTLSDIEIICVDDGSTDGSLGILQEYATKDSRIILLNQKNQGAGAARNLGLEIAKGEFLAFLDADDFFQDNFIEEMYQKAKCTNADVVICAANCYEANKKEFTLMNWSLEKKYIPDKETFDYTDVPNHIFNIAQNWNWNKIYKQSFISENNIKFQEIYRTNDLLFTCKSLVLAKIITTIDKPLVNHRIAQNSNCQSTNHLYPMDFYNAFKELRNFLLEKDIYDTVEQSYLTWAIEGCLYNINTIKKVKIAKKVKKTICAKGLKELGLEDFVKVDKKQHSAIEEFEKMLNDYKYIQNSFIENIFSIKQNANNTHKIITILGLKFKIKRNK